MRLRYVVPAVLLATSTVAQAQGIPSAWGSLPVCVQIVTVTDSEMHFDLAALVPNPSTGKPTGKPDSVIRHVLADTLMAQLTAITAFEHSIPLVRKVQIMDSTGIGRDPTLNASWAVLRDTLRIAAGGYGWSRDWLLALGDTMLIGLATGSTHMGYVDAGHAVARQRTCP